MILVDTSVWIDHLRSANATLVHLLEVHQVLCHPFVMGELACGSLRQRSDVTDALGNLPSAPVATHAEALSYLERHALFGRGIGWVDLHLLASTALSGDGRLWTRDKRLAGAARALGLGYPVAKSFVR